MLHNLQCAMQPPLPAKVLTSGGKASIALDMIHHIDMKLRVAMFTVSIVQLLKSFGCDVT